MLSFLAMATSDRERNHWHHTANRFKELPLQKANNVKPRVLHTNRLTKNHFGKLQGFKELPLEVFLEVTLIQAWTVLLLTILDWSTAGIQRFAGTIEGVKILSITVSIPEFSFHMDLRFEECRPTRMSAIYERISVCESGLRYILLWTRGTSLDNRTRGLYLMAEMDLVMNKCKALYHDDEALKKYVQDRQVMSTIVGQMSMLNMRHDSTVLTSSNGSVSSSITAFIVQDLR
ncbi:hypothetical protein DXG01_000774 [Tephrocybe rancida]|nr:hypothetical protein DXG01_000774 [Tephrocybe rancida]